MKCSFRCLSHICEIRSEIKLNTVDVNIVVCCCFCLRAENCFICVCSCVALVHSETCMDPLMLIMDLKAMKFEIGGGNRKSVNFILLLLCADIDIYMKT